VLCGVCGAFLRVSPQAFRELNTELWREGWFKPDDGFMSKIVTITFALLAACVALLCAARFGDGPAAAAAAAAAGQRGWGECERGALVMAAGLCLSQFWQQSLLIAHDACHTGITRKRRWDALIGAFFGGACAGLGTSWWTKDHNEHHAATNQVLGSKPGSVGGDRSCGLPPFLTVSEKQLARDDGKKGQPLWCVALPLARVSRVASTAVHSSPSGRAAVVAPQHSISLQRSIAEPLVQLAVAKLAADVGCCMTTD
jgi:hypothetical protein